MNPAKKPQTTKIKSRKILDIGCGLERGKYKSQTPNDKVIGLDIEKLPGVDVVADIEKGLPFSDNEFDVVVCNYVLEQIKNFFFVMQEIHRILKPHGVVKIRVPFYASWAQYNDPLHVRSFSYYTFDRFSNKHKRHYRKQYKDINFKTQKRKFIFALGRAKIFNPIINPLVNTFPNFYSRFLAWIIPCVDLYFELEKV